MIGTRAGRILSAVGAVLLVAGLFLTWYHIDRTDGPTDTSGWQTFTRLRWVVLVGALALLASALVRQTRAVLAGRFVLGLVLAALILRRIIDPPAVDNISSQFGVFVGLVGAICAALGGLVDTSREVVDRYPDLAFWREPAGTLGPGSGGAVAASRTEDTIDSTADEL